MNDSDLERNLSMIAHTETPTAQPEVTVSSGLDQQLDAAVRDVETWLRNGGERQTAETEIPNLVQPTSEQASEAVEDHDLAFEDPAASAEEQKLRVAIRTSERRMLDAAKAGQQLQNRLLIKLETEAKFQSESFTRRREEEELAKQAAEEAARRRQEDELKLQEQRKEIRHTQRELKSYWEEERRLRI